MWDIQEKIQNFFITAIIIVIMGAIAMWLDSQLAKEQPKQQQIELNIDYLICNSIIERKGDTKIFKEIILSSNDKFLIVWKPIKPVDLKVGDTIVFMKKQYLNIENK